VKIVIEEEERMLNYRQQKDTSPSQPVVTDILGTFHNHWTWTVGRVRGFSGYGKHFRLVRLCGLKYLILQVLNLIKTYYQLNRVLATE
jgi:hypothetical protein